MQSWINKHKIPKAETFWTWAIDAFKETTYLLETWIGSSNAWTVTSNGNGKVGSKANVTSRYDTQFENLPKRCQGLGCTSRNGTIVQGSWWLYQE
jgi:hypothetical protein